MIGSVKSSRPRASNSTQSALPTRPPRLRVCVEIRVDQPREEPIGPVGVRAFRRVELLLIAPHALAVLQHRHFVFRDNLVGNVDDVLGVVEEGDLVVITSDQQNLAIELDEAFERRAVAERVAPRLRREQMSGLFSPRGEARGVIVDDRAGRRAEEFDERAVVARASVRSARPTPEVSRGSRVPSPRRGSRARLRRNGPGHAAYIISVPSAVSASFNAR